MRHTVPLRLACLAVLMAATGCVSWQPADISPAAAIRLERPERVRVTRDDGMQAIVDEPQIRDDDIVGRVEGCVLDSAGSVSCGNALIPVVALDRVALLEIEYPDRLKTLAAWTVGATVGLVFAAILWAGQACADGATFYC